MTWLLVISGLFLCIGVLLRLHAKRRLADLEIPGKPIYWDSGFNDETFFSERHGLTGKPDYILKTDAGELVPIERKSRELSAAGPYEGEILQLAAYCLLIEEHFETTVHCGQLQYGNRSIDIKFDQALRRQLLAALKAINDASSSPDGPRRSHNSPARCRACGFRTTCGDALP